MSAVSCGYQEREVQPLLEFSGGVAETAVPMQGVLSHAHRAVWSACPASLRLLPGDLRGLGHLREAWHVSGSLPDVRTG